MKKLMEIPKETPEPSKKSIAFFLVASATVLVLCLLTENLRLRRIIAASFAFVAVAAAIIDFLWDLVLPTKARKERIAAGLQGVFCWLLDYGYQVEKILFLEDKVIQIVYSSEKNPPVSIFYEDKIKTSDLTLWAKGDDEEFCWFYLPYFGNEWLELDWSSDEFSALTYQEYCEKVFSALGIQKCDDGE